MTNLYDNTKDETYFLIMRILHENPDTTQRELAAQLGISLGGLNFCLGALIKKGFVKMSNFQKSKNKFKYVYFLTPRGISEKVILTSEFLQRKMEEYEALKVQIKSLKAEVESISPKALKKATR